MTTEVAEESEPAWDHFLPDPDDADIDIDDADSDADARDGARAFDAEDDEDSLELAKQDLELRWDAFEGDDPEGQFEDEAAAADAARITAALERMERRVMGVDDELIDEPAALDEPEPASAAAADLVAALVDEDDEYIDVYGLDDTDNPTLDHVDAFDGAGAAAIAAISDTEAVDGRVDAPDDVGADAPVTPDESAVAAASLTPEERLRIDAAFARMEEALFGDGGTQSALYDQFEEGLEPDEWLDGDDEFAGALHTDAPPFSLPAADEAPEVGVFAGTDEPGAWLDDEDGHAEVGAAAAGGVRDDVLDELVPEAPAGAGAAVDVDPAPGSQTGRPLHAAFASGAAWTDERVTGDEVDDAAPGAPLAATAATQFSAWDDRTDADDESDLSEGIERGAVAAASGPAALGDSAPPAPAIVVPPDLSGLGEDADADEDDAASEAGSDDEHEDPAGGSGTRRPAHAGKRYGATTGSDVRRLVLLGLLFFAVVIGAVVLHFGHIRSGTAAPPATAATPGVSSQDTVARLESAITDVQSASTAAQAGLTTLTVFPTPARVATIINPYVDSLQLYETLASSVQVPAAARDAAQTADTQVHQDIAFLGTIDNLPSVQLGFFIDDFFARSTQLQSTMDALEHALTPAAP